MVTNKGYESHMAIPPGETLQEILDDRSMTQKDLALRMGLTPKHINKIIKGSAPITHETALKLESVLGISARFWNNLEMEYQETLARIAAIPQIEEEISILDNIPYKEMAKHGWVAATSSVQEKIFNLRRFFGVAKLDSLQTINPVLFRKSEGREPDSYAIASWLAKGENEALNIETAPYDKNKVENILPQLKALTKIPLKASLGQLQSLCASVGIAFVLVPHLPKTYVNGAAKWLSNNRALIVMSIKGKYEDIFWFSFFHEIGHILQHQKNMIFIDDETNELDDLEVEANEFASQTLIPQKDYMEFIETKDFNNKVQLRIFSDTIGVHIGIVIGRMMKENLIPYGEKSFEKLRQKINISF